MNFVQVKNERDCYRCGSPINYGEEAVVIRIKHTYLDGHIIPQFFHPQCYLDWNNEVFMYRLRNWRASVIPRPERKRKLKSRLGRPKKYKNPTLARRIKASLWHYKKVGNQDKVQELEEQLNKTLIRSEAIQQNGQTV